MFRMKAFFRTLQLSVHFFFLGTHKGFRMKAFPRTRQTSVNFFGNAQRVLNKSFSRDSTNKCANFRQTFFFRISVFMQKPAIHDFTINQAAERQRKKFARPAKDKERATINVSRSRQYIVGKVVSFTL